MTSVTVPCARTMNNTLCHWWHHHLHYCDSTDTTTINHRVWMGMEEGPLQLCYYYYRRLRRCCCCCCPLRTWSNNLHSIVWTRTRCRAGNVMSCHAMSVPSTYSMVLLPLDILWIPLFAVDIDVLECLPRLSRIFEIAAWAALVADHPIQ